MRKNNKISSKIETFLKIVELQRNQHENLNEYKELNVDSKKINLSTAQEELRRNEEISDLMKVTESFSKVIASFKGNEQFKSFAESSYPSTWKMIQDSVRFFENPVEWRDNVGYEQMNNVVSELLIGIVVLMREAAKTEEFKDGSSN